MSDATYTIGEFSRLTGLTEKALRLYDSRRLLEPVEVDTGTGYRRYSKAQVADGRMVAMLRAIDMPLAEIADVLAVPGPDRSAVVRRYWYRLERALDTRRRIVRSLHHHNEKEEYGMSYTDNAIAAGRSEGAFAAIAQLATLDDAGEAANAYGEAMKTAYWDEKDLPLVTALAYAGVDHLLALARRSTGDDADEARSVAKAMMYNLASFTWTGWDEPGIEIGPSEAAAGLAAARTNLAMAIDMDKGDLAISRGHWMLGAHQLTAGGHTEAIACFVAAADFATRAGAEPEAKLSRAFGALAALADGRPGAEETLDAAITALGASEGGSDFVGQIETARAVIGL